jgi:hypothetical protein
MKRLGNIKEVKMCNFHVGQKVVYVGPDRTFDPNPGKTVHVIEGIRRGVCCSEFQINVGVSWGGKAPFCRCTSCGKIKRREPMHWKSPISFRPLIEDYTEEEIEAVNIDEVLEPFLEPVNK